MSTYEANRERTVRSIENQLRGINITPEQADRILLRLSVSAGPNGWLHQLPVSA